MTRNMNALFYGSITILGETSDVCCAVLCHFGFADVASVATILTTSFD